MQNDKKQETAFGKNLAELLEDNGITHTDLAKELHVEISTVSKWINAGTEPSYFLLMTIAHKLHVSVDYLLEDHSNEKQKYIQFRVPQKNAVLVHKLLDMIL